MALVGLASNETGPPEVEVRTSRRRRRHSVAFVLLLAARFSFTTFVFSVALWLTTTTVSIALLVLSREAVWSAEASWVVCFAVQQFLSVPLAWYRRRVLLRQRAQGRQLTQLELGLCFLQIHALVSLVGSMCLFTFGALIALQSDVRGGPEATQPLREWQHIATVLAGGHFLLPLLGYYGMALFFPFVIAGMAQQAAAQAHGSQPQLHPAQALGGAAERRGGWPAALGYGLGADALAALPVMLWRAAGGPAEEEEEGACRAQGAGEEEEECGEREECEECAICCCGYSPGDAVRLLPCKHHFHQKCIDSWLRMSTRCPMCRGDLSLCPGPGPDGAAAATAAAASAATAAPPSPPRHRLEWRLRPSSGSPSRLRPRPQPPQTAPERPRARWLPVLWRAPHSRPQPPPQLRHTTSRLAPQPQPHPQEPSQSAEPVVAPTPHQAAAAPAAPTMAPSAPTAPPPPEPCERI
eukprot:scaffold53913_cov67-Phaeocystis_antarctica.AAC.19